MQSKGITADNFEEEAGTEARKNDDGGGGDDDARLGGRESNIRVHKTGENKIGEFRLRRDPRY
jgi:hypothetical protein